ncbi:threonine dehydratase [Allocatelliglobosispora scoriae]|uniref:Threonine dehydratase n=1 Tax=Allocatelliglobosispora scoriae TaxID=643052 RepID=A0A841BQQ6_9ACTN|nr:threonine/serine dehydratase [Allocatelliglobosispora scoriae]MBB5869718.1 threonine dehydratase [Allocatelliglobosispora scoriae]
MITRDDVDAATVRIAGRVRRTPLIEGDRPTSWLKLEYLQHTGSFKARGAVNRVLGARESGELTATGGIVVASGGNAGLANAYAARAIGVAATVFVPETAPAVKVAKLRAMGATVVQHGSEYAVAYEAAVKFAADTGAVYCHAYDQPEIVAGAGTTATELLLQVAGRGAGVDTIVVAVGGGGLMAGVAAAVEGVARVVAVEPVTIPTLHTALDRGGPVDVAVSGIAADSLGARRIGDIAYAVAVRTGVQSVLVADEEIIEARRRLWQERRIVVEHGAAAALAALTSGVYRPEPDERVAVILCGANTDPSDL